MSFIRPAATALLLTVVSTTTAAAQSRARGYLAGGPGVALFGSQNEAVTLQGTVGAEGRFETGFAAGVELGYLVPAVDYWHFGFGVFSPTVSYYGRPRGEVTPFVSGGYSLAFREGTMQGWNVGGGVEMATRRKASFRIELRDYVFPWGRRHVHFVALRVGATFR